MDTVGLLAEVLLRLGNPEAAALLMDRWDEPASGAPGGRSGRRQVHHRAFMRAFFTAVSGAVLLASEEEAFADLVLSPQFGDLHPYNPECWAKLGFAYELGQARLGQARCLVGLGDVQRAAPALGEACGIFARMGAKPALLETESLIRD